MDYYNTLLISPAEVKQESQINQNVDDKPLAMIIQTAQEIYLCKIIGTPLYRRLQQLVDGVIKDSGDKITDPGFEIYNELLEDYVKPYLKYKSMEDYIVAGSFKMRNIGVVRNMDSNVNYADLESIRFLQHHYNIFTSEYEDRLSKFICANREMLPEMSANVASYLEQPQPGETFAPTAGLWLGGSRSAKGCKSCG